MPVRQPRPRAERERRGGRAAHHPRAAGRRVDSPEFRLDGQPVAATRAGDAWQFTTGTGARRLVVGDGKRDLLALRLLPDTPADAPFNDWTIYHLMLADFANGDANNDRSGMRRWVHSGYSGGDLQGVLGKVDHLKALGVNAVWLSPLFASETSHGYDVMNYYRVGDAVSVPRDRESAMQLYQRTVEALHGAGIRVVLDLPLNHGSGSYERQAGDPKGLKPKATSAQQEAEKTWDSWNAGFRYWNFADAGTREFLLDASRYWLTEGKADGFRLDYVRGVPPDFWAEFYAAMKTTKPNALLFGEAWQDAAAPGPNADDIATYYAAVPGEGPQFDGLLDFPLQMVMTEVFARGTGDASDLEHWLQRTAAQYGECSTGRRPASRAGARLPASMTRAASPCPGTHSTSRSWSVCRQSCERARNCRRSRAAHACRCCRTIACLSCARRIRRVTCWSP